MKKWLLITDQS